MSNAKKFFITSIVSILLVGFIAFLIYVIYAYGYYNKGLINEMTYNFNKNDFDYVYDNLTEQLDRESFDDVINLMYDKNALKDIYYLYYSKSEYNIESFYDEFYFGDKNVDIEDIDFNYEGKTNLFKRSKITYNYINIENKAGNKSAIGVLNNITLEVDNGSELFIDGKKIECSDKCLIEKIYGGLHQIKYINNKMTYFGLLNIPKNDAEINISSLNSLIKTVDMNEVKPTKDVKAATNSVVKEGIYNIYYCYLDDGCGNKKKSYLKILPDNYIELYLYNNYEVAGNYFYGTYKIDEDILVLHLVKHDYVVYDYDYGQTDHVEVVIDAKRRYKILNDETIDGNDYRFTFKEELPEPEEETEEEKKEEKEVE